MKYVKTGYKIALFISFIFFDELCYLKAEAENVVCAYQIEPIAKNLQIQAKIAKCRLFSIPTVIALSLSLNHSYFMQKIYDHPVWFLLGSYLFVNYMIDSFVKYREMNQTIQFFLFSQTLSRYLLCIFAVKNTMKRLRVTKGIDFNEQEFMAMVAKNTGYTIAELETFTFQLLNSSIDSFSAVCIGANCTEIEEKIYFALKDQVTLEQMLLVCKNDAMIYQKLLSFYENPEKNYQLIMKNLCTLIHDYFNNLIKKKFFKQ